MADPRTAIVGAHIHGPATSKENAEIILDFEAFGPIAPSPIRGTATIDNQIIGYMLDGLTYSNIHSEEFLAGEIRGQNVVSEIKDNFVKFRTILRGRNEIPPVSTSFDGSGELVLDVESGLLTWDIAYGDTQVSRPDFQLVSLDPELVPQPLYPRGSG